jgi:hypothetical protein
VEQQYSGGGGGRGDRTETASMASSRGYGTYAGAYTTEQDYYASSAANQYAQVSRGQWMGGGRQQGLPTLCLGPHACPLP